MSTKREKQLLPSGNTHHQRKVRIVSLFAGAGGLDFAACSTGRVEAIVSTDSNATFLSTVETNMPTHFPSVRHAAVLVDARELKGNTLKQLLGATPDLVMGGPPCDDYTIGGRKLGLAGEKGSLIFEFLRVVEELQPECFVFENVPNLVRQFKNVFERFLAQSRNMGYHVRWSLMKACDYGAPTQRTRVIVVGWRNANMNRAFCFPDPTHSEPTESDLLLQFGRKLEPFRFVRDVLEGLPDVNTPEAEKFFNHTGRIHRPATIEYIKTIPIGKQTGKSFRYRSPWNGLTQSLTAGLDDSTKSQIHPHHHREMSVREYARIHLFPDSWHFLGTNNNGIKQVANSVPIPLGIAVLTAILKCLTEETLADESPSLLHLAPAIVPTQ